MGKLIEGLKFSDESSYRFYALSSEDLRNAIDIAKDESKIWYAISKLNDFKDVNSLNFLLNLIYENVPHMNNLFKILPDESVLFYSELSNTVAAIDKSLNVSKFESNNLDALISTGIYFTCDELIEIEYDLQNYKPLEYYGLNLSELKDNVVYINDKRIELNNKIENFNDLYFLFKQLID